MVTLVVMGLIAVSALTIMYRVFTDTGIIQNRRDVLGDGRVAIQQMTKQIRQATSIHNYTPGVAGDATKIDIDTYFGATSITDPTTHVIWRTTGSAAPYTLEVSMNGGTSYRPVVASLQSPNLFTYVEHDGVLDQVTVALSLGTKTSTVDLTADVELRNMSEESG